MVQDIYPRIFHNQYRYNSISREKEDAVCHVPMAEDRIMIFSGRNILLKECDGEIRFPRYGELFLGDSAEGGKDEGKHEESLIYLFSIDNRQYFLYSEEQQLPSEGYEYVKLFDIRRKRPMHRIFAAETAYHLYVWYRDNHFCGRCGSRTEPDARERMLRCPRCGNMIFPRIAPAVIVAVTRGEEILLTTYANREYKRYALIAGFTEIGETAEETVRREVMEEVGLSVKHIRYYKSQPWGFDGNLLFGFFCEVEEAGAEQICMDEEELASAEWVHRNDVPEYTEEISLTHEMMMVFKKHGRPAPADDES